MLRKTRAVLSLILVLMAAACVDAARDAPRRSGADQAEQRARLERFERAARYARAYRQGIGQYPSDEKIAASLGRAAKGSPKIGVDGKREDGAFSVGCSQEESFHPAPTDAFVLSAWNGNGFDCFAFPSARTNLQTGLRDPTPEVRYSGGMALLLGLGALALWPWRKRRERVGER